MMPSLSLLGEDIYESIMNGFLQHAVLEDRSVDASGKAIKGWNNIIILGSNLQTPIEAIKTRLNQYAKINYSSPSESYLAGSTKCENMGNYHLNQNNMKALT